MDQQVTDDGEDDFTKLLHKYAPEPSDITDIKFSAKTKALAQELAAKVKLSVQLKAQLTETNKRINEISFRELPDLFNQQELTVLGIANGVNLELTPYYQAGLTKKMDQTLRAKGVEYVRENAPEILKVQILLNFKAGELEAAEATKEFLTGAGLEPVIEENVHHKVLTSWVKERFLEGKEVPFEILNAKIGSYVRFVVEKEEKTDARNKLKTHESTLPDDESLDDEVPI